MRKTLLIFSLLVISPAAFAQNQSTDCVCNAALAKDVISVLSTDSQHYAFLLASIQIAGVSGAAPLVIGRE